MQITIFGASGKVGRRVVELALARGHTVVAVVHSHDPFTGTPKLIVKKGDIYNTDDVREAVVGSHAVLSTLGSWGTPGHDILTSAMRAIIPAMETAGISRIVTLTGSGAVPPPQPESTVYRLMMRLLKPFPAGKVFADGQQHMQLLAASQLDWTTVRAPVMRNGRTIRYKLVLKTGSPFAVVTREAVATAMLDQLESAEFSRQAPAILLQ